MSAPSPETSMQTPQREFAVQNYNKKMTYANKNEKIVYRAGERSETIQDNPSARRGRTTKA